MKWKLRRVAKKCFLKNSISRTKYRLSRTFKNFFDKKIYQCIIKSSKMYYQIRVLRKHYIHFIIYIHYGNFKI